MKKSLVYLFALIYTLCLPTGVLAQKAYELTDKNFEHDTQATTGSTTGDWLILFCEYERFKKCNEYQPFWDELSGLLRGKTSVAYINVNKQWRLRDQFDVHFGQTPYIVMLHRGHTYKFTGDVNSQDALLDFAIETFHDSEHKHQVPIMPTLLDEFRDMFNYSVVHKRGLIGSMLMKDDDGSISYMALFSVYVLPVLIVIAFYYMMQAAYSTDPDTVERTQVLEELNRLEKKKIDNWI